MKSGTTFLTNLLENHGEIKLLKRSMKYSYFDDDRVYKKGEQWYKSLFKEFENEEKHIKIGQTSADCAFNPNSVDRILKYNSKMKLIFVLRHPVDRAYSLYWHQYGMGREYRTFENAIKNELKVINKSYHHFKHYSYLERSRYNKQFEHIIKIVPKENILFLDFNSLVRDTKNTVNQVFEFLEVSKIEDLEELNLSKLKKNPAKITLNRCIVFTSYLLQKIGLVKLGRRFLNSFRKNIRPPKMNPKTRALLEEELSKDIFFYKDLFKN